MSRTLPLNDVGKIREAMENGSSLELAFGIQTKRFYCNLVNGAACQTVCLSTVYEMQEDGLLVLEEVNSHEWRGVIVTS